MRVATTGSGQPRDFRLEDAWVLPTPGDPDDFPRLVQWTVSGSLDASQGSSRATRTLCLVRAYLMGAAGFEPATSRV